MLLWLFQTLGQNIRAFNVFNYLTLRAVLAVLTSMSISFVVGPWMISRLKIMKFGQTVRDDGPQSHLVKAGTPTMGGALILVSVAISTLLWMDLASHYVWIALLTTLGFGVIGWVDDYKKIVHKNPKGLIARWKYFWQSIFGIGAALAIVYATDLPAQTELIVPFFKHVAIPLGALGFMVLAYFVIVGSSNAVNLTDGLDGLAILPTVMVASALGIFAYVAGNAVFSRYLGLPHIPGAGELIVFCAAIAGAGLAFSVVQRLPGGGVHGRCGRPGPGGSTRGGRGNCPAGDRAVHHGRRICHGNPLGDDSGGQLQADRQAHLPHGAHPSPLRTQRLEGDAGGGAVLDHFHDAGIDRPVDAETEMRAILKNHITGGVGRDSPACAACRLWRDQTPPVRFWIISMMLVLIGLSTLKPR